MLVCKKLGPVSSYDPNKPSERRTLSTSSSDGQSLEIHRRDLWWPVVWIASACATDAVKAIRMTG